MSVTTNSIESWTEFDFIEHEKKCMQLRLLLRESGISDPQLNEAIAAYEREPERLNKIAELEGSLVRIGRDERWRYRLTKKQNEAVTAIKEYFDTNGLPPTVRDLAKMLNLKSPSTAQGYFERLRDKGIVTWEPGSPRTLRLMV